MSILSYVLETPNGFFNIWKMVIIVHFNFRLLFDNSLLAFKTKF